MAVVPAQQGAHPDRLGESSHSPCTAGGEPRPGATRPNAFGPETALGRFQRRVTSALRVCPRALICASEWRPTNAFGPARGLCRQSKAGRTAGGSLGRTHGPACRGSAPSWGDGWWARPGRPRRAPAQAGTGRAGLSNQAHRGAQAQGHRFGALCSFPYKTQLIGLDPVEERLTFLLNEGLKVVSTPIAPCVLQDILFLNHV